MKRINWITVGLSLAACSCSTTAPPTAAEYEDTAQAISSSIVTSGTSGRGEGGEILAMRDATSLAFGHLPFGFALRSDGRFHGNHLGVDHSFTVACKDAAGATLAHCNQTTDSATVEIQMTGSFQTPSIRASIDREGTWTITGLQSDTATFNGDSSLSLDTTLHSVFHPGVTSAASFDATASYDAIQIATKDHRITGGSASFEVKAHRTVTGTPMGKHDVDKSFDVTAVLTFHGDGTATLVLDGTQTFTIDLATGKVTRQP